MSEEGGGKLRNKKVPKQQKPYEKRKSFLGKVTDTVKELISPSWLSDLVNSVKKPSPQKDDEQPKTPVPEHTSSLLSHHQKNRFQMRDGTVQFSPPKFVPLTRNGLANLSPRSSLPLVPSLPQPPPQQQTSYFSQNIDPVQQGFLRKNTSSVDGNRNFLSNCTLQLGQTEREVADRCDEPSPPGLAADHAANQTSVCTSVDRDQEDSRPSCTDRLNKTTTWTEGFTARRPSSRSKPGFDISLFGAPLHHNSLLGESFHESSFYPGKTTYGGASAQRKPRLNVTAPYQSVFPMRQKMKVKPVNASTRAATSSTAQKILETLEKMSTPLSDAKKIPTDDTVLRLNSSFNPASYRAARHSIGSYMDTRRELQKYQSGPPRGKVSTPIAASISRNYQKVTVPQLGKSFLSETAMKSNVPSTSQESGKVPSNSTSAGGKLKSKKFQQHLPGRRAAEEEDEEVEIPDLRTDFTLPVTSIPHFDFGKSMLPTKTVHDTNLDVEFTFASPIQTRPTVPEAKGTKKDFTFSSPLSMDSQNSAKPKSVTFEIGPSKTKETPAAFSSPGFKFGSPVNVQSTSSSYLGASPVLPKPSHGGLSPASELKTGSVMDILGGGFNKSPTGPSDLKVKNDATSPGGFKPATELKQGSVMDILGGGSPKSVGTSFSGGFKPATQKGSGTGFLTKSMPDTSKPSLSAVFKVAEGSWPCDTCMINNKSDVTKCAACRTKKPDSSGTAASSQPSLSSVFKVVEGSWTCDTCMIQNKLSDTKCAACRSRKPGASVASSQPSLSSVFKVVEGSWTCDTCMIQNKSSDTKCAACQSRKPGASGTTSQPSLSSVFKVVEGSWTCDTCMIQNKSSHTKCAACQSRKPGASGSAKSPPKESLASKFKKPTGNWECDTCLVPNGADATKCIACETPRPGLQPSSFSGGLKIGGVLVNNQTGFVGQGGFKFGDTSKESSSTDSKSGADQFAFGMPSNRTSTSESPKGSTTLTSGFKFGTGETSSSGPSIGGFKFGTESNTTNSVSAMPGFKFGSSDVSKSDATTGGFQMPSSKSINDTSQPKSESSSAFKSLFGVDKSEITTGPKSDSTSGSTGNGSSSQPASSTPAVSFQFGGPSKPPPPYSTGTGFSATKSPEEIPKQAPLFNMQSPASDPVAPSLKRSHFEENGPSDAKRTAAFMYNAGPPTEPAKPAGNNGMFSSTAITPAASTTASMFQAPPTSTASTAATTGGFSFGMGGNSASSGGLGTTSFGATPANPSGGFNFSGAGTNKSAVFSFGAGAAATSSAPAVFGSSSLSTTTTGTTGTGGFFSGTKPEAKSSAPSSMFNFTGQQAATAPPSQGLSTPFGSGQDSTPSFGAANTPAFGSAGAVFGGASTTPSFGASGAAAPSGFGAATVFSTTSAGTAPAFGAATTTNAGSAGGFNFAPNQPGFNFGGTTSAPSASNGIFQFGAKPTDAAPATPQQPSTGYNFNASSTPSFNFAQNAMTPAMPAIPTGAGSFTIGMGSTNDSGRKIKKAVRKIRR